MLKGKFDDASKHWDVLGLTVSRSVVMVEYHSHSSPMAPIDCARQQVRDSDKNRRKNSLEDRAALIFKPDWASPPGDTISDLLEERNWTQTEFAHQLGVSKAFVSRLLLGQEPILEAVAVKLALVLGINAQFWLKREADFRANSVCERLVE